MEKKYSKQFTCNTFERKSATACWIGASKLTEEDATLEAAVLTYAKDNMAIIKVKKSSILLSKCFCMCF